MPLQYHRNVTLWLNECYNIVTHLLRLFYNDKKGDITPFRRASCGADVMSPERLFCYLVNCEMNFHAFSFVWRRHSWIWLSMLASAVRHTPSSLL